MRSGSFAGTKRFELQRLLGAGGMGVVYAAYADEDRCGGALKLVPSVGPPAAVRIKSGVLVASGLHHPNLVSLAELIQHAEHLFFTLELLSGVDWLSYVRGPVRRSHGESRPRGPATPCDDDETKRDTDTASLPGWEAPGAVAGGAGLLDVAALRVYGARLRSALRQLTLALTHLHSEDKVHCDIKPSNVLVSEEGRVVLLDFG